jgi:hypothetical protein
MSSGAMMRRAASGDWQQQTAAGKTHCAMLDN